MPPKKTANGPAAGIDSTEVGAITALCHLIMSCDDFKANNRKIAPIFGIKEGKNVPRKINGYVNPYGFEFKGGKMISLSDSKAQDGAAGPSDDTSAAEDGNDGKIKKAAKAPKPNAKARQGPAKKRKLADSFPDEDDSDHVKEEDVEEA